MREAEARRQGSEGFCQALSSMEGGGVQGRGCVREWWLGSWAERERNGSRGLNASCTTLTVQGRDTQMTLEQMTWKIKFFFPSHVIREYDMGRRARDREVWE